MKSFEEYILLANRYGVCLDRNGYRTPRTKTKFVFNFWSKRWNDLEAYLDKLFSLEFQLEGLFE